MRKFFRKLRLTQAWLCGDYELKRLLNEALLELEAAQQVVAAAEDFCATPDSKQISLLALEVAKYRGRALKDA